MSISTLHLTNYWHERSGGIATFYRQLMAAANAHGRRMALVVPGERDEIECVGTFCRVYKISAPRSPLNHEYRTIYPSAFLLPGSGIQKILTVERPDVVEICDKYTLVHLGSLLRFNLLRDVDFHPVMVGLTCERMDENFATYVTRSAWGQKFAGFYMRHVYFPAFDHHIAISENTAAELKTVADGHIVPRGVWTRPMGVDIEHFSPEKRNLDLRKALLDGSAASESAVLLLYVGRLAPEKNLDLLIATMVELEKSESKFRLVLAGDGIARSALERDARTKLKEKVVFLGHISGREDLAGLYTSCDFFVHPNLAEPFGIAPLEAMASGLPLIAPDRGGVTSYANDGNAYLSSPTPGAFAETILMAARSREETARKAQAARKTAEGLAWPKVTESFLHLYDTIHALGAAGQSIEAAQPAFVSSPPNGPQAARLSFAAKTARKSFMAYLRLHRLLEGIGPRRTQHYQPETKDMPTR